MAGHRKTIAATGGLPRYMGGARGWHKPGRQRAEEWDDTPILPIRARPEGVQIVRLASNEKLRQRINSERARVWHAKELV